MRDQSFKRAWDVRRPGVESRRQTILFIARKLYVSPEHRDEFVESHRDLIQRARTHPGVWM